MAELSDNLLRSDFVVAGVETARLSPENPDQLEALSSRYTDAARTVPLSSGGWAIFDGWGKGESMVIIKDLAALPEAIRAASFRSATAWRENLEGEEARRAERAAGEQKAQANIEDLGL
jgi:hypothetical protein